MYLARGPFVINIFDPLFSRSEKNEQFGAEGRRKNSRPNAGVSGPELFCDQAMFEKTVSGPSILFINKHAYESKIARLFPDRKIKPLLPIKSYRFIGEFFP